MNYLALLFLAVLALPSLALASHGKTTVRRFDSEEDVAVALAKYTANLSDKYIKEKGSFSVVLSGGTLIQTLRKLLEHEYNTTVNWSKWLIFWVDERVPIPQSSIFPITYNKSPAKVAVDYEVRLKTLVEDKIIPLSATGFPKFDLILLGIGPDGHIASLFPNRPQRYEKERWITFITDSPKPPPPRITFTFPVINSASDIAMVVTDKEEANAVAVALGHAVVSPTLPCAEVKAKNELTWFLDKEAASKLL
ncbi:putative 6-phosphogluconolactonase 4, chloroplastic [Sesamum alatum]|uniref:6-phosphogluconolactonase 4, chloroplastic n=1 Tax=Sesamum alatum TaxID=300844 RepID=A0AAE2CR10_9LAMI|nr:putative 6-phosphogluconolactonase 4, chloroplastic [Sesamum alatum]